MNDIHKIDSKISLNNLIFISTLLIQIFSLYYLSCESESGIRNTNILFLVTGSILFINIFRNFNGYSHSELFMFLFVYYLMVLILYNDFSSELLVTTLEFVMMISVWKVSKYITVDINVKKILTVITFLQGCMLIGLYFSPLAYKPFVDEKYVKFSEQLTLGFDNPNQTGMIIYATFSILLLLLDLYHNKIIKFIICCQQLFLLYLLYLTDSRASILSALVVLIYYIFFKNRNKNLKKHYIFIFLIFISSILFVGLYMFMFEHDILTDVQILGKKLFSGRQRVFADAFNRWDNKLFGNLDEFLLSNSHNAFLTILVNTGIIGLILYVISVFPIIKNMYDDFCNSEKAIGFVIIMSYFINAWAESACLINGNIYYANLLAICVLTNNEHKTKLKNSEIVQ